MDQATKDALVAADPRSEELLKPVLRGRDIARYRANWAGLWLIDTHNGHAGAPPIDVEEYPAAKAHLDGFYEHLVNRHDQGVTPYNLRNCAYHEEFGKPKLFWIELSDRGRFSYDDSTMLGEATTFVLTGEDLKFLCAVLNSKLVHWFLRNTAPTSGMGTLRWKKTYVETIPIPLASPAKRQLIVQLVDRILACKTEGGSPVDMATEEAEIERRICELYSLSEHEIRYLFR